MASGVHGGVRANIGALREKIEVSLVTSISERRFLPIDQLREIFTLPAVKDALYEIKCEPEDRFNLVNTVHQDGKKVFAMLIDIWQEDLIVNFRKHGALDDQLPLDTARAQRIVGPALAHRLVSEVQWKFNPFVFPEDMWQSRLHIVDPMIFPFVTCDQIGFGAFGDVEKIGIYPCHQNFADKEAAEVYVVRKRLKPGCSPHEFEREDKCLRLLNGLRHPNIVPFLGSYTHKKRYYFLFPYIQTHLGKFLESECRQGDFRWNFTFYAALAGLASALAKTHRLVLTEEEHGIQVQAVGYHHDLRPPNVLVSQDNFILADFGLGRLKDPEALSRTPYKLISGDWIAPECTNMDEIPQSVNAAIDIWAFGCLILEVITYMLKGRDGRENFRKQRLTTGRFPECKDSGFYQPQAHGGVKQEVKNWVEELRLHSTATDAEAYLLKLGLDTLQADPGKRPTMDEVYRCLAGASVLKHFHSVEDMFRRICRAEGPDASNEHYHLESLQFAQQRFKIWGAVLSLRETVISGRYEEIPGKPIEVLTTLFHLLREEPQKRASRDWTCPRSFEDSVDRCVKELWDMLPSDLLTLANDHLRQSTSGHGLHGQVLGPPHRPHDEKHSGCATVSSDALLREFEDLAESFKNEFSEFVSSDQLMNTKSMDCVHNLTFDLQHSLGLLDLPRIKLCLKRLHSYVEIVGGAICGSSEYFGLIWGPLGLLIRLSSRLGTAYNEVIKAIAKIGDALPDFYPPDALLKQNSQSKEILVLLFKDILYFYSVTLKCLDQTGWIYIFDRLWPNTWAHISEISSHISRLTRLMRTEISLENIYQEHEFRKNALEQFKTQARETHRQEFDRIKTSLKFFEYNDRLYELREERSSGTGKWLFRSEAFTEWVDNSHRDYQVLWLKGIPGAGKTVLAATIVDHLKCVQRLTCFAFLTYEDERISALSIMHSLIFQLAETNDERVDVVRESMCEELKSNLNAARDLLKSLILHAGSVCLVIDGIDEISKSERGRLVKELLGLMKSCDGLRVIISSRPEADLTRALDDTTVAMQVHDHNKENIELYVEESTQRMLDDRKVDRKDQDEIKYLLAPIARRAKGMFLYARLMMRMAEGMHSLSEIRNELAVLPENLDDAYHRIISRLDKHSNKINAEKARRLLGWIACTVVPLTVEEAQQALAVESGNPGQIYSSIFTKIDPVEVLGPIVETASGQIRFVHFTAKEYVSSAHLGVPLIDINEATVDLAIRCIDYLCQDHHDPLLSDEDICTKILTGQYSFDAFASQMWFELSSQYLRSVKQSEKSIDLVESIQRLWECRKLPALQEAVDAGSSEEHYSGSEYDSEDETGYDWIPAGMKEQTPQLYNSLRRVYHFRHSSFLYTGEQAQDHLEHEQDPLSTLNTSKRLRQILDKKLCNEPNAGCESNDRESHEHCADILHYYGQRPFKCRFPRCEFWRQGFGTRASRRQHQHSHENPVKCDVPGCKFRKIGFLSEKMRQKHIRDGHSGDPPQPKFDQSDLQDDSVEPLLHYLVAKNRVEEVERVLSALSNFDTYNTTELRKLASSAASPAMLKLLEEHCDEYQYHPKNSIVQYNMTKFVIQSIKGCNEMTLAYNVERLSINFVVDPKSDSYNSFHPPLCELMSTGWLQGLRLWCKACRQQLEARKFGKGADSRSTVVKRYLSDPRLLMGAAKDPAGEEAVLFLWRDSGLLSYIEDTNDWASRNLRHVARLGCSVTLAIELLNRGANVNYQPQPYQRSALHCAAGHNSSKGAEMIKFLLLNGADPEATLERSSQWGRKAAMRKARDQKRDHIFDEWLQKNWSHGGRQGVIRRIRDEKGAQNIHKWLEKSWDELVEETKHIRTKLQVGELLQSE